jgi:capsular exopolysaccharide synthesis family protein
VAVSALLEPTYASTVVVELEGRTHDFAVEQGGDPISSVSVPNPTDDLPTQVEVLMSLDVYGRALNTAGVKAEVNDDGSPADPVVKAKQITQTNVIALTVESKNPRAAQSVARSLNKAYDDYVHEKLDGQLTNAISFMHDKFLVDRTQALKQAQDDLEKFRRANNITNGDQENSERLSHLASAESDYRAADQRLSSAKEYYASMLAARKALPLTEKNSNISATDRDIELEKEKIADVEATLASKKAIYTDNSQEVKSVQAQLDKELAYLKSMPKKFDGGTVIRNPLIDAYDQKLADAKGNLDGARAALVSAQIAVDAARRDVEKFSSVKGEYDRLSQAVLSATQDRDRANQQYHDLLVRRSDAKSPISIVSSASPPIQVKPIWLLNIAVGVLAGIALSWGLVRLRESSDDRIWSSESALEVAGLPALGSIGLGASRLPALITNDRSLAQNDNYRILRTSLLNTATGEAFRSIAVTSALGDEGRSETAVNLAASMAMGGHQVVLIDANFRSPSLATLMSLPEAPGLAELLRREAVTRDVARASSVDGMHVITAGRSDTTSADLLGSESFSALIEDLKERYHFVIVDTSPCLAGADGPVTAAACEASIYVVKLGTSRRSATRYCIDMLKRTRAHVLGVVTNRPGANPKNEFREYADA